MDFIADDKQRASNSVIRSALVVKGHEHRHDADDSALEAADVGQEAEKLVDDS